MQIFLKIIGFWLFVTVAGYIFSELTFGSRVRLNFHILSLCFGLGSGFITLEMFLLSILGFNFNLLVISLPWLILLCLVIYRHWRKQLQWEWDKINFKPHYFQWIIWSFILFFTLFHFIRLFDSPLYGWDALMFWNYKAKVFYLDKRITLSLFSDKLSIFPHRSYPLAIPLLDTLFYMFLGNFDDLLVKAISFIFYLCLLVGLYNFIKIMTNKNLALMGAFFLATIPVVSRHIVGFYSGYADLPFSYFNLMSIGYLLLWLINEKEKRFFNLSSVLAGLAFWFKLEGAILIVANLSTLTYYFFVKKQFRFNLFLQYGLRCTAICLPWLIFINVFNLRVTHMPMGSLPDIIKEAFIRLPTIAKFWGALLINERYWNIFWVLFLISLIFIIRKKRPEDFLKVLYINLFLQIGMNFLATIFNKDFELVLYFATDRLLLHILPLAILILCINLSHKIKEKDEIIDYSTGL